MEEITFPVLVLDDECRTCDDLEIVSDIKTRIYADDVCVSQEVQVRCSNVYKCQRLMKRLRKEGGKA